MRTVGSVLREDRLKQGLTLESVSVETKLPLRILSAIEGDDLSAFGSPFFYKSFVKQYALRVRLDYSEIAPLVEASAGEIPAPPLPGEREKGLPGVSAIDPPSRQSDGKWMFPTAALVAVLVGCSAIYAWWEGQHSPTGLSQPVSTATVGTPREGESTPAVSKPASPAASYPAASYPAASYTDTSPNDAVPASSTPPGDTKSSSGSGSTLPETQPEPGAPSGASATAPVSLNNPGNIPGNIPGNEVQLKLSALERVWVSVVADGKSIFSGVLEASDIKTVESRETTKIRVGNAGGLRVVFNGRSIGPLGPRGQVLTAVFTPRKYEILNGPVTAGPTAQVTPLGNRSEKHFAEARRLPGPKFPFGR